LKCSSFLPIDRLQKVLTPPKNANTGAAFGAKMSRKARQ